MAAAGFSRVRRLIVSMPIMMSIIFRWLSFIIEMQKLIILILLTDREIDVLISS